MAKPRLIILIRHAQSEGNKNREIHQSTPDHRVKLTQQGWGEAHEAGRRLRNLLRPDDTLHFFTSPYRRTRETTEGILETLTSDEPGPSPFPRSNIKVYEEPRLREQDFGNFQPCSDEMERMWQERADYGHFFYRIPNGESAADAYDRVSGFNESLWRQFGEDDFASVCVLVTHGLMSRIFLMKWYHFSVEYFEDLRNVNHCEFLIMRKQDNGKYHLENNLRTWSQLRRERALKEAKEGKDGKEGKEAAAVIVAAPSSKIVDRSKSFIATRRWGGCPNGCNHSRHYKKREDLEVLRQKDTEGATTGVIVSPVVPPITTTTSTTTKTITAGAAVAALAGVATATANTSGGLSIASRRQRIQRATSSEDEGNGNTHKTGTKVIPTHIDLARTMSRVTDEPLSSPEIVLRHPHHLHIGRDFGGTYSGHTSTAGSDTDASDDDHHHRHHHRLASAEDRVGPTGLRSHTPAEDDDDDGDDDSSGHHRHNHNHSHRNCANRLGDVPADGDGDGDGQEDLDKAEKEDRSVKGSVY